ncbi:hypothetical protein Tco_0992030 [Tanacetum coccineum]|uniref:Reverse transcriptase domain-containing protein n=1 Tax=Tanacetum coccineum TaxID=301880 RepID=A0ABQ5F0W8_9ASTR
MRTRSQTRNRNRQQQSQPAVVQPFHLEEPFVNPSLVLMADNRTMTQLLQAPTEGYEDAIVIPKINANFELKHGLINLVQNKQFFGHDKEDPHAHIRYFNKITSTMRFPDVPSTSIKLMLFPFSLEGSARIWLEKELIRERYSIHLYSNPNTDPDRMPLTKAKGQIPQPIRIGKPKRKDTQIPQSSDLNDNVVDEAVHKELGDSLVRAATTTSSLEAKQDSDDTDKEMFDVDALNGEEVFVAGQNENVVKEVVDAAQVKRDDFQDPGKSTTTTTISSQQSQDKAEFDKEERLAREKAEKEQEANIALIETGKYTARIDVSSIGCQDCKHKNNKVAKKRRARTELAQGITKKQKVEDDKEIAGLKQSLEIIPDEEEVEIDAIPLAVKSPSIVDWKIHKQGRKSYYHMNRAAFKT